MSRLSDKINKLFAQDRYADARVLLEKELVKPGNAEDHWLLTRLATTYYEERQYNKALELEERALALAPNCPLVLWDYAGTLDALGRSEEAMEVYLSLIERGPEKIGREECGEGEKWAIDLLTDCFYGVSVCLRHLHRSDLAWKFFVMYAQLVAAGADSIYAEEQSDLLKHLVGILREQHGEKPPRSPRKGLKQFRQEAKRLLRAA